MTFSRARVILAEITVIREDYTTKKKRKEGIGSLDQDGYLLSIILPAYGRITRNIRMYKRRITPAINIHEILLGSGGPMTHSKAY